MHWHSVRLYSQLKDTGKSAELVKALRLGITLHVCAQTLLMGGLSASG